VGIVVFWIGCAIATAIVAGNKGRSAAGWLLLGALLGPVALLIALVVSANKPAMEAEAIGSGSVRKCPFCAELIKAEAIVCKHCGRDVPQSDGFDHSLDSRFQVWLDGQSPPIVSPGPEQLAELRRAFEHKVREAAK
jgi:hypothetical protein